MTDPAEHVDVVVIGGGPAGAATATYLARAGHDVVLLERSPTWRWRAGGVFASPAAVRELRHLGLDDPTLARVARPIPAMRVELPDATTFRLTYGAESTGDTAVGFDRSALDPALLAHAVEMGVDVRCGVAAGDVQLPDHRQGASVVAEPAGGSDSEMDDEPWTIGARVIVGADGPRSIVAEAAGMIRQPRLAGRIGLSWHVRDAPGEAAAEDAGDEPADDGDGAGDLPPGAPGDQPAADGTGDQPAADADDQPAGAGDAPTASATDAPRDARMVVLRGGAYCGIAPVPGGRVNIGIVLAGEGWRDRLSRDGAAATGAHVLATIPRLPGEDEAWRTGAITDRIAGASPLGSRVERRSGPGWVVVGDAAGFLDPFTGEGLHRALVSARLAAEAIDAELRGRAPAGLAMYDAAMRDRFGTKDVVSLVVQAFLARPALFAYAGRRLARRDEVRATMGLVMGDLVPASRALDPRFLARLLAP